MWKRTWWRGFNAVKNDDGYSVKFIDRNKGIEYSEDDHVIRISVETAAAEVDWVVHWRPLSAWRPPHEMESITEEKSQLIKQRVVSGLNFLKVKFILLEP